MKKLLFFVAATIWTAQAYSQTTFNVSSTGTNSGTSYTTVRAAIAAAAPGDIIQLAAETFTEKNILWTTPKSLTIKGSGMNQTIIQADATTTIAQANDCGVFKLDAVYTAGITVTIQDLTIQNGYNAYSGGGIRLTNTGTQANAPTLNLTNLKILANRSTYGGGIYVAGAAILNITGCNINGNSMTSSTNMGGGIAVSPGTGFVATVTIKNSTIAANSSLGNGGGIAINCGANGSTVAANSLWVENSTIYGNSISTSAKMGGGIYFKACLSGQATMPTFNLTLNHCTIVNNTTVAGNGTTTSGPDGVCVENSSGYATTIAMNNCIIVGNSGSTGTNACQIGSNNTSTSTTANGKITVSPVITNSIFGIIASGTWTTTTTNNKLDAVMADLAFASSLSSDATPVLKIGGTSIAKNYVTTNYLLPTLPTDELGNNRDASPDAGAYELPLIVAATAVTGGAVTSGTGSYYTGSTATLVATPNSGYRFINWTENGTEVSTNASYGFTVSAARTLVANFMQTYLIAASAGTGGSVTSGSGNYDSGTTATVVATPNSGYHFINWKENGTEVSTSASYGFTVSTARTLVANFDLGTDINSNLVSNQFVITKDAIVSNVVGAIQIYSISGKMITNQPLTVGQIIPLTVGSYIVRVVTNNEVFVKKISF
ncbi:MAG: hypothetical protein WCG93_04715 [Paludibacter sp.]